MKLRLCFGLQGFKVDLFWLKSIKEFPNLVTYKGRKWEFVMYDRDLTNQADYNCVFVEIQSYDPNWYATVYVSIEDMLNDPDVQCQCGSTHTDFPQVHMFFCPKWTKQ